MTKQLCRIQARAILWRSARQVTMPHDLCLREKLVQLHEESLQSFVLCSGERVGRFAMLRDRLSSFLNTKVQFSCSAKGKGKISIPFANEEELEHIMNVFDKLKQE